MLDYNKLTEKAQESVIQAQNLVEEYSNNLMENEHLLLALLEIWKLFILVHTQTEPQIKTQITLTIYLLASIFLTTFVTIT